MKKVWGGGGLLAVASFMGIGFTQVAMDLSSVEGFLALAFTVALPGLTGLSLLHSHFQAPRLQKARQAELRGEMLEAEVLRLARERGGKLVAVEVAEDFAIPVEEAKEVLNSLARREVAEIEVSDSGLLVYSFHDLRHLSEKETARGVLDA